MESDSPTPSVKWALTEILDDMKSDCRGIFDLERLDLDDEKGLEEVIE